MENKKNRKYVIILVVATILFVAGMVTCIFNMNFTYSPGRVEKMVEGNSDTLDERLDYLEDYVDRRGPDVIYNELFYGHCYEPEFDEYWEFADIQVAGVRGRFADDNSADRKLIEDYIATCDDPARVEAAKSYLELME